MWWDVLREKGSLDWRLGLQCPAAALVIDLAWKGLVVCLLVVEKEAGALWIWLLKMRVGSGMVVELNQAVSDQAHATIRWLLLGLTDPADRDLAFPHPS